MGLRIPWPRNATTRLIAVHLVLVALSTTLVFVYLYFATTDLVETELREVVSAEADALAENYAERGVIGLVGAIDRRLSDADARDAVYLLAGKDGRAITGNLAHWPPTVAAGAGWVEIELYRTDRAAASTVSALSFRLPDGERLLVGRDAQSRQALDRALVAAILRALAAAALLSVATGWLLSRFVSGRVRDISGTAETIMAGDLSGRIAIRGTGDEFDRLGATLNAMLERTEALVGNLRTVTDSLAHDLRSPLTRLRAQTEALADPALAPAARAEAAERARREADAALASFTALIEIARAEAGVGRSEFETVDLAALAEEAAEFYEPVAAERGVALRVKTAPADVAGHPALLRQALSNLVENALTHGNGSPEISLTVEPVEAGGSVLSVADRGPGIAEADRARVTDRFVTVGARRDGSGLGLSLVRAVASLHAGRLELADNSPGLVARLMLPTAQADPPSSGRILEEGDCGVV